MASGASSVARSTTAEIPRLAATSASTTGGPTGTKRRPTRATTASPGASSAAGASRDQPRAAATALTPGLPASRPWTWARTAAVAS